MRFRTWFANPENLRLFENSLGYKSPLSYTWQSTFDTKSAKDISTPSPKYVIWHNHWSIQISHLSYWST